MQFRDDFRDFAPDGLDFLATSGHAHAARGSLGSEQTRPKHLDSDRSSQPFAAVEGFDGQLDEALIRHGATLVHELFNDALTLSSTPRTRM